MRETIALQGCAIIIQLGLVQTNREEMNGIKGKATRPHCPKCNRGNPTMDGEIWHHPSKGEKTLEAKVWTCKCGHTWGVEIKTKNHKNKKP
jgi:hypothetical protein